PPSLPPNKLLFPVVSFFWRVKAASAEIPLMASSLPSHISRTNAGDPMTVGFERLVDEIQVGEALSYGRLNGRPLYWKERATCRSPLQYLTLNEAIERKRARVTEVSEQGSVPQMMIVNEAQMPVFVPDGSILIGGKQNRVVNMSLLLTPESITIIPV